MKIFLISILLLALPLGFFCKVKDRPPEFLKRLKSIESPQGTIWYLNDKPQRGRALLIHGLLADHTVFFKGLPSSLVDFLDRKGWQVLFIDLPHTTDLERLKADLKDNYGPKWQKRFEELSRFFDSRFGPAESFVVGGISWGALHTLMAAASGVKPSAYFTLIPAVNVSSLPWFSGISVSGFSPFEKVEKIAQTPGFFTWGKVDDVVAAQEIRLLVSLLRGEHAIIETHEHNVGHEITGPMINELLTWFEGLKSVK